MDRGARLAGPFFCVILVVTPSRLGTLHMEYESPDLCIRSLVEYKPGYYYMDMPSRYDPSVETPYILEIDQETLDILLDHDKYPVPMCPPGWPNDGPT